MPVFKQEQSDKEKAASARGKYSHARGDVGEKWMGDWGNAKLEKAELSKHFGVIQKRQNKGDKFLPEFGIVPRWDWFDHIIHGECKWRRSLSIYKAMDQARNAAKAGAIPIVFHRRPNLPVLATLEVDDLWQFVEAYLREYLKQQTTEE